MDLRWPLALLLLLVVPLLLGAYIWRIRKTRASAVRFSNVALVRAAVPARSRWRRHIPAALFLTSLASLAVASTRPQASIRVPTSKTSIILALDVSRSMCATDVEPNRLAVAQDAARKFVRSQPSGTRIGIVSFAGYAEEVVPPTKDKKALIEAIDSFTTARGTAIGAATLKSIDAIAAINNDVRPTDIDPELYNVEDDEAEAVVPEIPPRLQGDFVPDIVVVLTDGANTQGISPLKAAKQAIERRVRVYTIGFGTTNPTDMSCSPQQLGGDVFGSGGGGAFGGGGGGGGGANFGNRRRFLTIDEPTLTAMANMTGGQFYKAENANQLQKTFANLPRNVQLQKRDVEISVGFVAFGATLAALAMFLSLRWNRTP